MPPVTLDVIPSNPRRINRLKPVLRLITSKTRYRATTKFSEVIENMERERGLEPPASSLGNRLWIENSEHGVHGAYLGQ